MRVNRIASAQRIFDVADPALSPMWTHRAEPGSFSTVAIRR